MLKLRAFAATLIAACVLAGCGSSPVHQAATGSAHPAGWGGTPQGYVAPRSLFGVTPTREMFDTVTLSTVPAHPFALAGYTAGLWPTFIPLRDAYPSAHVISIAIATRWHADCLDVEPGDATPSQAGSWALADIRAGFQHPCLYSDLSEMPSVKASLAAWLGSSWRARVLLWLAWYRFVPGLASGYDAVQWSDRALGRNLDESTVSLRFLSIAQPPYIAPIPKPRTVCFGSRRSNALACRKLRGRVAGWQRARDASGRGWTRATIGLAANRCSRPYRRVVCVDLGHAAAVLSQREQWFAARANATTRAWS